MSLDYHEFWATVCFLCASGLIYLISEELHDAAKDSDTPWRWGMKHRHARQEATWGSHLVLAPVFILIAILTVRLLLK